MENVKLARAKVGLLMTNPFFATMLLHKKFSEDKSVPSLVTNGKDIRFNPEYIETLSLDELKGVLCAEIMHTALLHHTRRGDRDKEIWNQACDHVMHPIIQDAGMVLPQGALCDPTYRDKSAEQAYQILYQKKQEKEQQDKKNKQGDDGKKGQGGAGQPQPGDQGKPDPNGQQQPGQPQNDPQGQQQPVPDPTGCGAVDDAPAQTKEEMAQQEAQAKQELAQALQVAKQAGKVSAGMVRLVEETLEPRIDWQEYLARFITQIVNTDYSFARPNKRFLHTGFVMPSLYNMEVGDIALIVDTSISMDKGVLDQVGSDIQGLANTFKMNVQIVYVDTKVCHHQVMEKDEPTKLEPKGGGGTDFRPGFEWLEENDIAPKCVVYLTDGECNSFPEEPDYPVLWAIYGRKKFKPPFGDIIEVN